jgi:3-isopropylmalate/(R)-2-methylmalate dehydratase large subunit
MSPSTLFDKVWDAHVVEVFDDDWALLHIDRHLLHDFSGPSALVELRSRGLQVHAPELAFATPDHLVSSATDRTIDTNGFGGAMWATLRDEADQVGIVTLEMGGGRQGIVHVIGPEQGIVLPGLTVICGDSHTCTNGALGALAFGVGSSQSTQALATQVLLQQRPRQMRITIEGALGPMVSAKDLALSIIGRFGAAAGAGHAVEYAGSTIDVLDIEARLTLCNLTVELGAKFGMIAPDDTTIAWVTGRPYAPSGASLAAAVETWRGLCSDDDAVFDREEHVDASTVLPTVTWGTSPEHVIPIDAAVPDPATATDETQRAAWQGALDYMGLRAGQPIAGTPVDWVFIGSCANSRLSDLRAAAAVVEGGHVAPNVTAWVVPGSELVRAQAEAEGLDAVFRLAGFEWRQPGCSMCVAANGERVPPKARCVSTSNRNFVGRQGAEARTHLASPATAAAAALSGMLVDPRTLGPST